MTDHKAVMQQALDWVNDQGKAVFALGGMNAVDRLNEVSKALTVAIAQPEQQAEPVAWAIFAGNGNMRLWSRKESYVQARGDELGLPLVPLYAHPIAQPDQPAISEFTIADLAIKHLGSYAEKDYDFAVAVISASMVAQLKDKP